MASFTDNVWNAAQYKLGGMMVMPEYKYKPSAALSVFLKNTDFLIPASQREAAWNQKESDQRVVEINTIDKQASSAVSNRAYNHSGSKGDGTKTTVSYTTYGQTFTWSIKEADGHVFEQGDMLAKQILSASINLHSTIETAYLALLNTNKTQVVVSNSPTGGTWDSTNYIFEVAQSDINFYFQKIKGMMRQQYYNTIFDVVNDEFATQLAEKLVQQGQGNAENQAWQMMGMSGVTSQEAIAAAGQDSAGYIIPAGTVGVLPWVPKKNREGFGNTFQNGGQYRMMPDPLGSGLQFAVHEYASGADNHSGSGERQDVDIEVEISIDLGPVIAPMSTSNLSPILKTALLSS